MKRKEYYLKCTYRQGMFSNEKLITFRVLAKPVMPFGIEEPDGTYKFQWFLQAPGLIYLDDENALMPVNATRLDKKAVSFWLSVDQEVRELIVPLEEIVAGNSARALYESAGRILRKREEENRRLMEEVSELLKKRGRK